MSTDEPALSASPTGLIAEDEPLLAEELAEHLAVLWPELRLVARVGDGVAALHAIEKQRPDVAFLDIEMPLLSGLDVARQIAGRCHVVFITAYDQHALGAFEAGAIDYVMKPLSYSRLVTTVGRLKVRILQRAPDLSRVVATPTPVQGGHLQWVRVSRGATVRLITVDEICYFKADSKYTLVVTKDAESLIRKSIKELADELDPDTFWQIHRAVLVNVHAIDSVFRDGSGGLSVRLKQRPETLSVSEQHHHLFRQM
ncbi:LytTR family DNA-binding domain-containing protein [Variovorax sp. J22R133]|uniref:LytR/AlgR family response regulator transcription factor n=1 Tax=Variovorax brevis TaxID=3053503 RepID=UPI0025780699|nr:LytTR family DNA-binding domain-containing protein [Variovorax sp. J22R133]MDM0110521.1 LytTR family DNA-binding domain-containing protein [Variovorax sp. J22R133]